MNRQFAELLNFKNSVIIGTREPLNKLMTCHKCLILFWKNFGTHTVALLDRRYTKIFTNHRNECGLEINKSHQIHLRD